jgi:MFS family permease
MEERLGTAIPSLAHPAPASAVGRLRAHDRRAVARVVAHSTVDGEGLADLLRPRRDLLVEREVGPGRFEAEEGPMRSYRRTVTVEQDADGRSHVTSTVDFSLAVPYFWWLFVLPFKRALARPERPRPPWWAPPARLDQRAASVLGTLGLVAVVFGYLNTLFTQTISFAGDEFGAGNSAQGVAGAVVRVGGLLAVVIASQADRQGRRTVILRAATAGCVLSVTGAVAPSLPWFTASQTLARGLATSLLVVVAIVAAEEMPAGSRAYAVSLLAMAGGLGAGICVLSLRLADVGTRGWRLLYVVPLLALPLLPGIRRRLPETRRFAARHAETSFAGHGGRLWLLAGAGLLTNLFIAPQSQFGNRFLRSELGFSGARIGAFSVVTGTPASIGIVVGGRVADVRGRRMVGALALLAGSLCTLRFFFATGWTVWVWAVLGNVVAAASIPALGVYGPELFPTSLRGRANGIVAMTSLGGSAVGLIAAGVLSDHFGRIGPAMAVLAVGPALVALLVLTRYPETARLELEELNPEDRAPPPDT